MSQSKVMLTGAAIVEDVRDVAGPAASRAAVRWRTDGNWKSLSWAGYRQVVAEALAEDSDFLAEIDRAVAEVNAPCSRHEGIKEWRLLAHDFGPPTGELTPRLKVRRNVVVERCAKLIDEMYVAVSTAQGAASMLDAR